jgi:anti-sigma factor RsiW
MKHPPEVDLALLTTGDLGPLRRRTLERHIRGCAECDEKVARFQTLRAETANFEPPADLNWKALEAEMRANIHLGLEAGACVSAVSSPRSWNPRLTLAFASLLLIVGSSFLLRNAGPHPGASQSASSTPVLESTGAGIELRSGSGSMMLLNRPGVVANQTVSAGGEIRARYIDGETGAVTINNVSLE